MTPEQLAEGLREVRMSRGWTQKQLAKVIGRSDKSIASFESASARAHTIRFFVLLEILNACGVSMADFSTNYPTENAPPRGRYVSKRPPSKYVATDRRGYCVSCRHHYVEHHKDNGECLFEGRPGAFCYCTRFRTEERKSA